MSYCPFWSPNNPLRWTLPVPDHSSQYVWYRPSDYNYIERAHDIPWYYYTLTLIIIIPVPLASFVEICFIWFDHETPKCVYNSLFVLSFVLILNSCRPVVLGTAKHITINIVHINGYFICRNPSLMYIRYSPALQHHVQQRTNWCHLRIIRQTIGNIAYVIFIENKQYVSYGGTLKDTSFDV